MTKEKISIKETEYNSLLEAAKPLIKYLAENHHPHVMAMVTNTSIELLEGMFSVNEINDFIND